MKLLKSLGQYLVVNKKILYKMVRYADLGYEDVVLEVGCGTGRLTRLLLKNVKKVYGIEIDSRFINYLKKIFEEEIKSGRLELIHGDATKVEFPEFDKFVSNIPYQISSPITFKLFKHKFKLAVLMYQREFAERLVAKPGSKKYGRLSVVAKAYCRAEILDIVPPTAFKPRPKVESAIVRIIPEPEIEVKNKELFEDLVTFAFSHRRKMFGKILEEWCELKGVEVDISEELRRKRPEELPPNVFAEIVDQL
ncbi:MAG TPA: ribosomal RNA small subunit methyltransferase A [Archaeoglobus profundus]|nr:ribosomal RNA small subunit methyltransferase A [Archaeoglobus profundus]